MYKITSLMDSLSKISAINFPTNNPLQSIFRKMKKLREIGKKQKILIFAFA